MSKFMKLAVALFAALALLATSCGSGSDGEVADGNQSTESGDSGSDSGGDDDSMEDDEGTMADGKKQPESKPHSLTPSPRVAPNSTTPFSSSSTMAST